MYSTCCIVCVLWQDISPFPVAVAPREAGAAAFCSFARLNNPIDFIPPRIETLGHRRVRVNDTTHAVGKPPIIVRNTDYARLIALAQASMERESVVGDELMAELERASVMGDESAMRQTIQMGSTATYTTENGEARTVILVYPGEANIEENRVSILTPIGVALLGLSKGQTINWVTRDGHVRVLSVTDVAG